MEMHTLDLIAHEAEAGRSLNLRASQSTVSSMLADYTMRVCLKIKIKTKFKSSIAS